MRSSPFAAVVRALLVCALLCAHTAHADGLGSPSESSSLAVPPLAPATGYAAEGSGPPVVWGMVGGALTALVPLTIGATLFAQNDNDSHRKIASLTIAYGMALAPIVSHLAVREWARAAIFGAVPLACAISVTTLLEVQPTATTFGSRTGRWVYGLSMSLDVLSAGLGVIDTLGARLRHEDRVAARRTLVRVPVLPAPFVTSGGGGVAALGTF